MKSFAISGTPGIGKSLFFVYILYRLIKDFTTKTMSLKPNRIIYQMGSDYKCFDLHQKTVTERSKLEAALVVREQDTLYIIDGQTTPVSSSCITLFISSPRSAQSNSHHFLLNYHGWFKRRSRVRPYSYKLCVSGSCNDCTLASTTTRCTSGIATTLYPTVTAALSGLADCGQALFTLTSVFKQGHMNPSGVTFGSSYVFYYAHVTLLARKAKMLSRPKDWLIA